MPKKIIQNEQQIIEELQAGAKYKDITQKYGISYALQKRLEKENGIDRSMNKSMNKSVNNSMISTQTINPLAQFEAYATSGFAVDEQNFFGEIQLPNINNILGNNPQNNHLEQSNQLTETESDTDETGTEHQQPSEQQSESEQQSSEPSQQFTILEEKENSFINFMQPKAPPEVVKKQDIAPKAKPEVAYAPQQEIIRLPTAKNLDKKEEILNLSRISVKSAKKQNEANSNSFSFSNKLNDIPQNAELTGKEVYIIQIRKYIQHFKHCECIQDIIGRTKQQTQSLIRVLPTKTEEQLKFIRDNIKFELLLSQMDEKTIPDNLKQFLQLIEAGLTTVGIDVVGCSDELFTDDSFKFYLQMTACEITYLPSPQQMVFFKFIKSYYKKYMETKTKKKMEQQMAKPVPQTLIDLSKQI